MSNPSSNTNPTPAGRPKPTLIAAAQNQARPGQPGVPGAHGSVPMSATNSAQTVSSASGSVSASSTPAPRAEGSAPPGGVQKLKFKPKVPIRRVKQEADIKPDITPAAAPPVRGGLRGRGRGGPNRGRGRGTVVTSSIAAGVFGGPRPVASSSSTRRFAAAPSAPPKMFDDAYAEVYSDHSDDDGGMGMAGRPIDIDMVSQMSESAPTSLYRDRRLGQGKAKAKGEKHKDRKGKKKSAQDGAMDVDAPSTSGGGSGLSVKAEPISPEKQARELREDDAMQSDDENQDRDERGRRVRSFAQTGGIEDPEEEDEVNEAHKVDLSESEEEEEEEDMEGDFVQADGSDNPEEKLFIFQFPHLFPKFQPAVVDMTQGPDIKPDPSAIAAAPAAGANGTTAKDVKPDIKPTAAQLRTGPGAKKAEPLPEGRVGTMVVMKSGKVKIVMGKDIVMNVTPGLPATFIQHLVHLDSKTKSAQVLGEVHKNYVVTPDIDRLLHELYIHGGQTPGEVEAERRRKIIRERGLVPMKKERE